MADYYTRFSLVLKLQVPTQQEYALDLAAKARRHRFEDEPLSSDSPANLVDVLEDWNFETEKNDDGIWLHSDYGGTDAVCAFIQHLLQVGHLPPSRQGKLRRTRFCNRVRRRQKHAHHRND